MLHSLVRPRLYQASLLLPVCLYKHKDSIDSPGGIYQLVRDCILGKSLYRLMWPCLRDLTPRVASGETYPLRRVSIPPNSSTLIGFNSGPLHPHWGQPLTEPRDHIDDISFNYPVKVTNLYVRN